MKLLLIALTLSLVLVYVWAEEEGGEDLRANRAEPEAGCPYPDDIKPCTCKDKSIRCFLTVEIDIEQIFKAIGQGKSDDDKQMETLELSSSFITEIKDNLFHGVTFRTVKIMHCSKLTCVSPTAFYGMERTMENFVSYETSFSHGDKPGCNIFDSLKRMRSLRSINMTASKIREIPDNAFQSNGANMDKLTHIDLSGNQGGDISKIGKYAFSSLKSLKYLDISLHQLSKIDSNALYFEDPSNEYLTINLESNLLTGESFDQDSFSMNGRIVTLKLGGNPNIQVLRDTVFRSFLINTGRSNPNEQNIVDLRGSPLQCNRQNLWLLENKFKLQRKVLHVISAESGMEFWRHTPSQCAAN